MFFSFWDKVTVCIPGCPRTHCIDKAGLKTHSNPPVSVSWMWVVQRSVITPSSESLTFGAKLFLEIKFVFHGEYTA